MDQISFADIQEKTYLRAARIFLNNIYFTSYTSRFNNNKCKARLLNLFQDYLYNRDVYENRIFIIISQKLL